MSKYLITGATGFLGRHLVSVLREAGHTVVALVRTAPELGSDDHALFSDNGVTALRGDVLDTASVASAAAGCDGVFHCAGRVSRRAEDAEDLHRVHVDGTKSVLAAMRQAGVKRCVVASTSGVVAVSRNERDVLDEEAETPTDLIGRFPYYRSKLYAEQFALEQNGSDLEVIVVNPTLLLGPGDVRGSSTGDVVAFLERRWPAVPSGGLSFVDARDAAQGMLLAMDRGRPGERYLLSAQNLTLDAFCQKLERISGVKAPGMRMPANRWLSKASAELFSRAAERFRFDNPLTSIGAEMSELFWYVNPAKAERELGWLARDPGETLSDTVDDLKARGVVWPD